MKKVIIINGYAGVGKDTFSSICSVYRRTMNYSSVDKIKELAFLCGWDGVKDERGRKLLSDLKLSLSEYCDLPFRCMADKVKEFNSSDAELLFLHIREPEEIVRAAREFNAITLLIENPRVEQITSNAGDANVHNLKYDCVITNYGTIEDFHGLAKWFIEELEKQDMQEVNK